MMMMIIKFLTAGLLISVINATDYAMSCVGYCDQRVAIYDAQDMSKCYCDNSCCDMNDCCSDKVAVCGDCTACCVDDCEFMPNGNYQSCETCNGYVSCVHRKKYDMPCPASLVWNVKTAGAGACQWTSSSCPKDPTTVPKCHGPNPQPCAP
eukprot:UN00348